MIFEHFQIKLFVDGEPDLDLQQVINLFHGWVAHQKMSELLFDVADYRHVPAGPSVVLVGHEADYVLDHSNNRAGLVYNRKAAFEGSNLDRMDQAMNAARAACLNLEEHFAGLKFRRDEFDILVNDRALAPNTVETWNEFRPELEQFVKNSLGHESFEAVRDEEPRCRFRVSVRLPAASDWPIAIAR